MIPALPARGACHLPGVTAGVRRAGWGAEGRVGAGAGAKPEDCQGRSLRSCLLGMESETPSPLKAPSRLPLQASGSLRWVHSIKL